MMLPEQVERRLAELPLLAYEVVDPNKLEFSQRVRTVCQQECPRYGKTWACPPAVGSVEECRCRCMAYEHCLLIATVAQISDIGNMEEALATRPAHEAITDQVGGILQDAGMRPYILSTEACALCERCAYLDGEPCRHPEKMHPCVESHGINLIPTLEELGVEFRVGRDTVTWVSLLFY